MASQINVVPLTHYCPARPFGKRKKIVWRILLVQFCQNLKKYHPSGNLTFNNLGIFQIFELRNLIGKILRNFLKLNFTPNPLDYYGLINGQDGFLTITQPLFTMSTTQEYIFQLIDSLKVLILESMPSISKGHVRHVRCFAFRPRADRYWSVAQRTLTYIKSTER